MVPVKLDLLADITGIESDLKYRSHVRTYLLFIASSDGLPAFMSCPPWRAHYAPVAIAGQPIKYGVTYFLGLDHTCCSWLLGLVSWQLPQQGKWC